MGEKTFRVQNGAIVWTDTRTLQEAKDERIAFMRARCDSEINEAMPARILAFAAFGIITTGDTSYDAAKTALTAVRTKLAAKTAAINAAATKAAVDAVDW